jgi:hypothetical protein
MRAATHSTEHVLAAEWLVMSYAKRSALPTAASLHSSRERRTTVSRATRFWPGGLGPRASCSLQ